MVGNQNQKTERGLSGGEMCCVKMFNKSFSIVTRIICTSSINMSLDHSRIVLLECRSVRLDCNFNKFMISLIVKIVGFSF
jgi:hypothetical protein